MHFRNLILYSSIALASCASSRNIDTLIPALWDSENTGELESRTAKYRCGPNHGKCPKDRCCSVAGYCGTSASHCRSPDCQINFGRCDGSAFPEGPPTKTIPRPKVGNVAYGPSVIRSCATRGTVALTFDDGPREYTSELLDLLEKYHAKATFFITGNNGGKGSIDEPEFPWADLIRRMKSEGHQIASHTWSHQDLSKITREQRIDQLLKNEMALRNILGAFPTYMRPPYSSCLPESGCLDDLANLGYHVVLYDLDTSDYSHDSPNAIQVSKDIFNDALAPWSAKDKSWMIIAHDVHEQTVHNLTEHMLRTIDSRGYRAVTVGECLNDPEEFWYREDRSAPIRSNNGTKHSKGKKPVIVSVTPDGSCGVNTTCTGSVFGECCSRANFCGNTAVHCGRGCQSDFGRCFWPNPNSVLPNGTILGLARGSKERGNDYYVPVGEDIGPWGPRRPTKSDATSLICTGTSMVTLVLLVLAAVLLI